jgi:uncharacterized protein YraI
LPAEEGLALKARLLLLVLLCLSLLATTVAAQEATETLTPSPQPPGSYVVASSAFVRGGPGETYPGVGQLRAGDLVIPVNRSADGNWVLIRYYAAFGWVRRDLVDWAQNIDFLPVLDETDLTPTPAPATEQPAANGPVIRTPVGSYVNWCARNR